MKSAYLPTLDWISAQRSRMLQRVTEWAGINTYSFNIAGIEKFSGLLAREFAPLGGDIRTHDLPPMESVNKQGQTVRSPVGRALSIVKRPNAALRVLLNIHLDTVYPADSPFQSVTEIGEGKLHGPGVADAKGGIVVLLTALEALERSGMAERIGWQVLLNPDEEIGSPGSAALLAESAKQNHFGLLFEPSLPDGALIDRRRGSGNFSIIFRGRAAHAGRDFASGRNAVVAASKLAIQLHALNGAMPGVTLNISAIDGGGPFNVVPDLAICRLNVRTTQPDDEGKVLASLNQFLMEQNSTDGIVAQLHGRFSSPPKMLDEKTTALLQTIVACGQDLGILLPHRAGGGASDGNRLWAAGLPNIDSLGVRGDHIHTPDEYLIIDSLVERARIVALLLVELAAGDIDPAPFCR